VIDFASARRYNNDRFCQGGELCIDLGSLFLTAAPSAGSASASLVSQASASLLAVHIS
jgi:hypothetical protein